MTEAKLRQSVVEVAQKWEPIKRGSALHKEMLAVYNGHRPLPRSYTVQVSDAYCATFVSACWIKAGVESVAVIECSCSRMVELAKAKGIWEENDAHTPKPGDALVYDWQDDGKGDNKGNPDHVGIVEKVEDGYMYILEGNMTGGSAGRRKIKLNNMLIRGFVCPAYGNLATAETEQTTAKLQKTATGAVLTLNQVKLYASATAKSASGTKTGTFYVWSGTAYNGRIRITTNKEYVGIGSKVTGWVNVADVTKSEPASTATPAAQQCTITLPILKRNSNSGYVKSLQILLNAYFNAGLTVDGKFGPGTEKSVIAYQRNRGIEADGSVGPITWAQLLK